MWTCGGAERGVGLQRASNPHRTHKSKNGDGQELGTNSIQKETDCILTKLAADGQNRRHLRPSDELTPDWIVRAVGPCKTVDSAIIHDQNVSV